MRVLDPLLFLAGHRGAIERIAATRHAWLVGAILVLSAGIARNYDHLDLLRQSEWFIGPFAASLVSIVFIFLCIKWPLNLTEVGKPGPQFFTFLTLAWMTAPCAWIYGIPVESMTDIVTATKWNIAFLAIVSLWRVFLMTRAVAVLTGVRSIRALPLILAPAALEMLVGSYFKTMSLVGIMGGVRLPPHTQLLRDATAFVAGVSFWGFIAAIAACWMVKGTAKLPLSREAGSSALASTWLAAFALAAWVVASLPFQPAVQNKHRLESLIQTGNYPEAVAFASSKQRSDFPDSHEFPSGYGGRSALPLLDATSPATPSWLRKEWTNSAIELLKGFHLSENRLADLNGKHPEIADALRQYAKDLRARWDSLDSDERWWLGHYETATKTEPPKNPPPTR